MRHSFIVFLVMILLASSIICLGSRPSKVPPIGITRSQVAELSTHPSPSLLTYEKSIILSLPNVHSISPSSNVTLSSLPANLSAVPLTSYTSNVGGQDPVNILSSFDGIDFGFKAAIYVPPDVQVAVGPDHVVEMVNVMAAVFAKNGSLLQAVDLNSLFNVGSDDTTDPRVLYDSTSGTWFASILDITAKEIDLGVSGSSDPSGNWHIYAFNSSVSGSLPDQPALSVTLDKVVVSATEFDSSDNFIGAEFWIMNKSAMMTGGTVDYVDFGPYPDYLTIYPTINFGSTSKQYMVSVDPNRSGTFVLFSVVGTPPGDVRIANATLSIKNFTSPVNGNQLDTRRTIDVGDGRVLSAIWDQSKLWFAFADSAIPAGDTRSRSSFRLVQVDIDTSTVLQDLDVNAAGYSYFYPALAVDGNGNLFVLFGYSSPNDYPGLMVTAQARTDVTNTYQKPLNIINGTGPETSGRYGDYFGAAVDPSNPLVVWVAGQYGTNVGWHTYIASISFATQPRVINIHLFGTALGGWGLTADSITSPGPAIVVRNGDVINLTLTSSDSLPHRFYVDYNGDQAPSLGEPASPTFQDTINYQFVANTTGTFTYYCSIHPGTMHGAFTVLRAENLLTDLNADGVINIVDVTIVARAFGSRPGSPSWNFIADLDQNGVVNIVDVTKVAKDLGKTAIVTIG